MKPQKKLGIEGKAIFDVRGNQVDNEYVCDNVASQPKFLIATEEDIIKQNNS